jgi:ABC-type xylose transport system permease subunit
VIVGDAQGNIAAGIALCLVVGILIGALNAFVIIYLRIPDLIATLSTFSVVTGLALIVRPSPGGKVSEVFADLITTRVGWFPLIGLAVILLAVSGEILQLRGRIGTRMYAIGSNPEAAFVAGIPVRRVRFFALTDMARAEAALAAGASFIVTPNINLDVIRTVRAYGIPVMPGALTPTEIWTAANAGADCSMANLSGTRSHGVPLLARSASLRSVITRGYPTGLGSKRSRKEV